MSDTGGADPKAGHTSGARPVSQQVSTAGPSQPGPPSDEELMDRYCAGDARAFDVLFGRLAPRLLRFARPLVGPAHAPDIVQLTFLKLHENRHRYRAGAKVTSWVFAIARNLGLDHVRSAPVRRELAVEHDAPAESAQRDVFAQARVRQAIADLPPEQRDVLLLHWFGELPFDEVARTLSLSSVAVRARAHRAYLKLREQLGDVGLPEIGGGP